MVSYKFGVKVTRKNRPQRNRKKIPKSTREFVFKRDDYRCKHCKATKTELETVGRKLTIDHIKPWIDGGKNIKTNLQTLCDKCNREKGRAYRP